MKVAVTGGAGYIGSHTCLELIKENYEVLIIDDLSNGNEIALNRIKQIAGANFVFKQVDIGNLDKLTEIFQKFLPESVIHFAGVKSVSESISNPTKYYSKNLSGTINLLSAMEAVGCGNLVFSSSATVYGKPEYLPYDENHAVAPESPYGRSKLMAEQVIQDWCLAKSNRHTIALRYFNPVGADRSGLIGEDSKILPTNIMPIIAGVAVGRFKKVYVFGSDYETQDGTGERDYVHVSELAKAHIAALEKLGSFKKPSVFNLGSGKSYSVLDLIKTFEKVSDRKILYTLKDRRQGDIDKYFADGKLAERILGVSFHKSLEEMCEDTWRWTKKNPDGFVL